MSVLQKEVDRRSFLIGTSIFFVFACANPESFLKNVPSSQKETKEDLSLMGDVVVVDNEPFLLRNGQRYLIPDLNLYRRLTKMEQKGKRKIHLNPNVDIQRFPIGVVPQTQAIIDPFTGQIKRNKPFGGEVNVYFAGMLTDARKIPLTTMDLINPTNEMFLEIKGEKGLGQKNWNLLDSLHFNYGKRGLETHEAKDTIRDPRENIKEAIEFIKVLKEQFPLVQFNLFGHSLGAFLALHAAMEHMDAVNNLILISGPLRGIEGTLARRSEAQGLKLLIKTQWRTDEQVIDYLFDLWGNKAYQEKLDGFSTKFVSTNRGLFCAVAESDKIVPYKSALLKGAKNIVLTGEGLNPLASHGVGLSDQNVIKETINLIGENLAAA